MEQMRLFDDSTLDTETRIVVQQRTEEIRSLMRRAAQDIIEIGQKLIEVRGRLRHNKAGGFTGWLRVEFDWSESTALKMIQVAERFNHVNFTKLNVGASALYLLASPSTPESAREEAIERAQAGEQVTYSVGREVVNRHKHGHAPAPAAEVDEDDLNGPPDNAVSGGQMCGQREQTSGDGAGDAKPLPAPDKFVHSRTVMTQSGSSEWYTPAFLIAYARSFLGTIDLDPASCAAANKIVGASNFYSSADDGLSREWHGRIWLNPPYGDEASKFVAKAIQEYEQGRVTEGLLLLKAATDTAWFRPLFTYPICFVYGRISFITGGSGEATTATFPSVLVYLGPRQDAFSEAFSTIGAVMEQCHCDVHVS
jgi:phage N-6-adenine-methyltransferase